jgi:hypothetical protein
MIDAVFDVFSSQGLEVQEIQTTGPLMYDSFAFNIQVEEISEEEQYRAYALKQYASLKPTIRIEDKRQNDEASSKIETEKLLQQQQVIEVAAAVAELMSADPEACDIMPAHHPAVKHFEKTFVTNNSFREEVAEVEFFDDEGNLATFKTRSILDEDIADRSEVILPPAYIIRKVAERDTLYPAKTTSYEAFKIEKEYTFPISYESHCSVSKQIEDHLTCKDVLNFRCAFSKVAPTQSRPGILTVEENLSSTTLRRRKCVSNIFLPSCEQAEKIWLTHASDVQ